MPCCARAPPCLQDLWGKVMWVWDRPHVQKIRLTITMANFSIRLPALVALVATQIGLLSTSLSLPMLAPLLLGTGMLLRSIRTNASLVFPRIGLLVVLLWLLWFANSVIQNTVAYLRKQGAIDPRMANNINSAAEVAVLVSRARAGAGGQVGGRVRVAARRMHQLDSCTLQPPTPWAPVPTPTPPL